MAAPIRPQGQRLVAKPPGHGRQPTVLYEKNARRKTFPASTTKIMACLVALENFPDLDQLVTVGPEAGRIPADSSKLNIREGEQYPMIDLLYGMMMRSGNDASMTVAVAVSGTVEDFVDLMNQKARELGCKDTFFVNPHGYHDEAHVSTAYDLALIARAAMENRTFREIAAARSYTMSSTSSGEGASRPPTTCSWPQANTTPAVHQDGLHSRRAAAPWAPPAGTAWK